MCGRYAISLSPELMAALFSSDDRPNLKPSWNVAPTRTAPMVALGREGRPRIILARWGLRPGWMGKDPPTGPLFNARGETVADKPAFRAAFARHRCLIPADGFYEWRRDGKVRTPFFITRADGAPMAFAGLWAHAPGAAGESLISMTIVTTGANAQMRPLHERLPVMVEQADWPRWLARDTPAERLHALIRAPAEGALRVVEVSGAVNAVANDTPDLTTPVR